MGLWDATGVTPPTFCILKNKTKSKGKAGIKRKTLHSFIVLCVLYHVCLQYFSESFSSTPRIPFEKYLDLRRPLYIIGIVTIVSHINHAVKVSLSFVSQNISPRWIFYLLGKFRIHLRSSRNYGCIYFYSLGYMQIVYVNLQPTCNYVNMWLININMTYNMITCKLIMLTCDWIILHIRFQRTDVARWQK